MPSVSFPKAAMSMSEDCYLLSAGWDVQVVIDTPVPSATTVTVKLSSGPSSMIGGVGTYPNLTTTGTAVTIPANSKVGYLHFTGAPNDSLIGSIAPFVFDIVGVSSGVTIGAVSQMTINVNDDDGSAYAPCAIPMFHDAPVCASVSIQCYETTAVSIVVGSTLATVSYLNSIATVVSNGTPGTVVIELTGPNGTANAAIVFTGSQANCSPMTLTASASSVGCAMDVNLSVQNGSGTITWSMSPVGFGVLSATTGTNVIFTSISSDAVGTVNITATDGDGLSKTVAIAISCSTTGSGSGSSSGGNCGDCTGPGECGGFKRNCKWSSCELRDLFRKHGAFFGDPRVKVWWAQGWSVPLTTSPQLIYAVPTGKYVFTPTCDETVVVIQDWHHENLAYVPPGVADPISDKMYVNGTVIAYDFPVLNSIGVDPRVYMVLTGKFLAVAGTEYQVWGESYNTQAPRFAAALRSILILRFPA